MAKKILERLNFGEPDFQNLAYRDKLLTLGTEIYVLDHTMIMPQIKQIFGNHYHRHLADQTPQQIYNGEAEAFLLRPLMNLCHLINSGTIASDSALVQYVSNMGWSLERIFRGLSLLGSKTLNSQISQQVIENARLSLTAATRPGGGAAAPADTVLQIVLGGARIPNYSYISSVIAGSPFLDPADWMQLLVDFTGISTGPIARLPVVRTMNTSLAYISSTLERLTVNGYAAGTVAQSGPLILHTALGMYLSIVSTPEIYQTYFPHMSRGNELSFYQEVLKRARSLSWHYIALASVPMSAELTIANVILKRSQDYFSQFKDHFQQDFEVNEKIIAESDGILKGKAIPLITNAASSFMDSLMKTIKGHVITPEIAQHLLPRGVYSKYLDINYPVTAWDRVQPSGQYEYNLPVSLHLLAYERLSNSFGTLMQHTSWLSAYLSAIETSMEAFNPNVFGHDVDKMNFIPTAVNAEGDISFDELYEVENRMLYWPNFAYFYHPNLPADTYHYRTDPTIFDAVVPSFTTTETIESEIETWIQPRYIFDTAYDIPVPNASYTKLMMLPKPFNMFRGMKGRPDFTSLEKIVLRLGQQGDSIWDNSFIKDLFTVLSIHPAAEIATIISSIGGIWTRPSADSEVWTYVRPTCRFIYGHPAEAFASYITDNMLNNLPDIRNYKHAQGVMSPNRLFAFHLWTHTPFNATTSEEAVDPWIPIFIPMVIWRGVTISVPVHPAYVTGGYNAETPFNELANTINEAIQAARDAMAARTESDRQSSNSADAAAARNEALMRAFEQMAQVNDSIANAIDGFATSIMNDTDYDDEQYRTIRDAYFTQNQGWVDLLSSLAHLKFKLDTTIEYPLSPEIPLVSARPIGLPDEEEFDFNNNEIVELDSHSPDNQAITQSIDLVNSALYKWLQISKEVYAFVNTNTPIITDLVKREESEIEFSFKNKKSASKASEQANAPERQAGTETPAAGSVTGAANESIANIPGDADEGGTPVTGTTQPGAGSPMPENPHTPNVENTGSPAEPVDSSHPADPGSESETSTPKKEAEEEKEKKKKKKKEGEADNEQQ